MDEFMGCNGSAPDWGNAAQSRGVRAPDDRRHKQLPLVTPRLYRSRKRFRLWERQSVFYQPAKVKVERGEIVIERFLRSSPTTAHPGTSGE
jgi:hypothetical protein